VTMADLHHKTELTKPRIGVLLRRRLTNASAPRRLFWALSMREAALRIPKPRTGMTRTTSAWSARRRAFAPTASARAMLAQALLRTQEWLKRVSEGAPFTAPTRIGGKSGPGNRRFAQPSRSAQNHAARTRSDRDTGGVPAALVPFLEVLAKILAEAALQDPRLENLERLNAVGCRD
jgi:hypothetical protein